MKRFMQMLLASFGVMALMLAGCSSTEEVTETDVEETTSEETTSEETTTTEEETSEEVAE